MGRASTKVRAAPSKSRSRRSAVEQHAADCRCCVGVCLSCAHVMPNNSIPGPRSLRLELYKMCFTKGAATRAAGRGSQGVTRNMRFAHARACVSTLLLYALGLVVRCPAAYFGRPPHSFLFYFQDAVSSTSCFGGKGLLSPSRIGKFPEDIFPRSRPRDTVFF